MYGTPYATKIGAEQKWDLSDVLIDLRNVLFGDFINVLLGDFINVLLNVLFGDFKNVLDFVGTPINAQ